MKVLGNILGKEMRINLDNLVTLDCEVYPNYFLAAFKNIKNNKVMTVEAKGENSLNDNMRRRLLSIMTQRVTFGFNSRNYDMPIILAALKGKTTTEIFKLSTYIIKSASHGWQTMQKYGLEIEATWTRILYCNAVVNHLQMEFTKQCLHMRVSCRIGQFCFIGLFWKTLPNVKKC